MNLRTDLINILQAMEYSPVKNLKELIEFNKSDTIELRYFDQKILENGRKERGSEFGRVQKGSG